MLEPQPELLLEHLLCWLSGIVTDCDNLLALSLMVWRRLNHWIWLLCITSHPIPSLHLTSSQVMSYHIISYHIISHHIISCHVQTCSDPQTISTALFFPTRNYLWPMCDVCALSEFSTWARLQQANLHPLPSCQGPFSTSRGSSAAVTTAHEWTGPFHKEVAWL